MEDKKTVTNRRSMLKGAAVAAGAMSAPMIATADEVVVYTVRSSGAADESARLALPGAVTFCYHGLLDGRGESVPFGDLHVTRDVFDGHCRLIAETCDPLSLSDLQAVLAGERAMPPRPIVITFDDGFANTLENAAPVLSGAGFTSIQFIVADLIGSAYCIRFFNVSSQ